MSLELFNEKMTETANAIRNKLGNQTKMTPNQFPISVNNIDIYQTEIPEILDPVQVREETRPNDWMPMPEIINENEIYMLFMVPTGLRSLISFNVTTTNQTPYTVQFGNMVDGNFEKVYSYNIESGNNYEGELYGPDFSNNPVTSDGFRQIMIKVTGDEILTFEPTPHSSKGDENRSGWNIFEISCNIPKCTSFKCGNKILTRALRNLVYFTKVGMSSILDFSYMFSFCSSLKAVIGITGNDNVALCGYMFYMCYNLVAIPFINFGKTTAFTNLFCGCWNIKRIPEIDFSNALNLSSTFKECRSLVYLHKIDAPLAHTVVNTFRECNNLVEIEEFNTPRNTAYTYLFYNCAKLLKNPLKNTTNAIIIAECFYGCNSLTEISIDLTNAQVLQNCFANCKNLEKITVTAGGNKVVNIVHAFDGCNKLTQIIGLENMKASNAQYAFNECTSISDLSWFNTSNILDANYLFAQCKNLTQLNDVTTPKATTLESMFEGCSSLISINKMTLITQKTTNMFTNCYSLSRLKFDPNSNTESPKLLGNIDLSDCSIGYQSMLDMFNSLPITEGNPTITLTGNRGAVNLTEADKAIAIGKGWTLII